MFYQFEADMQEIDNPILMHDVNRPFNAFKGILEHAKSDNKTKQSIFKVKESDYKINLVTDDEMELFLNRLDKRRDILLYKMLYLTGARIQEVLDLEIDSVPLPDMSQLVGCCYPAFYLVLNHTTFSQIKKGHSINYSDGFYIGLLYAVPLVIS